MQKLLTFTAGVLLLGGSLAVQVVAVPHSLAKDVKVEHPPYPERGLKGLVKPERLPNVDDTRITSGAPIWKENCIICHGTGNFGAPKITRLKSWRPRIERGLAEMVKHATEGWLSPEGGTMPARGGNEELTDAEVEAAVRFMVFHSGGQDIALSDTPSDKSETTN